MNSEEYNKDNTSYSIKRTAKSTSKKAQSNHYKALNPHTLSTYHMAKKKRDQNSNLWGRFGAVLGMMSMTITILFTYMRDESLPIFAQVLAFALVITLIIFSLLLTCWPNHKKNRQKKDRKKGVE